jgi:NAD(P)H-nitrite reductase large subunit
MSERLAVVGNGMAATRLVEHLVARGYAADNSVTIIGHEPHPAYNRILLSAVLEGTHAVDQIVLREPEWYADEGIELVTGNGVVDIDRERGQLTLVDGRTIEWDRLILATGSVPSLPPARGLVGTDGRLDPSVHAFRSLDDCHRLLQVVPEVAARGGRAVVVGGGLLGLQVARALSLRGVATEVVEGQEHLLARQVDAEGGAVLARHLRELGTEVYPGTRAVRLTEAGLRLDTGPTLETDLVILTAGGRPSTALARRAGLEVERGIVVGSRLESVTDARIHAIGDCAQHQGQVTGFVAPAWEQAGVLAGYLCGDDARYHGSRSVARLRATGLDVAVLGDPTRCDGETVAMTNPVRGTHRRLIIRDRKIVAAELVGDLSHIGLITRMYDQGTVLSAGEPGRLLMPSGASAQLPPAGDLEVCTCAGVTADQIRACSSLADVRERTRATTGCGGCTESVCSLLGATVGAR